MSLNSDVRYASGIAILTLKGRLAGTGGGGTLRSAMFKEFDAGRRAILLNCEAVDSADSLGIGDLVAASSSIVRQGGQVKLLRPHRRLAELLTITHLDTLFEIHSNESQAIASFNAAGGARGRAALDDFLE